MLVFLAFDFSTFSVILSISYYLSLCLYLSFILIKMQYI